MANIDLKNDIKDLVALDTQAISSDTTTAGNIVDTAGFESATIVQLVNTRTDGTYSIQLEDGDDAALADAAVVSADFLVGTTAGSEVSTANTTSRIGYVGKKRYIRANIVSTGVTTGANVGAIAVLGSPRHAVVA